MRRGRDNKVRGRFDGKRRDPPAAFRRMVDRPSRKSWRKFLPLWGAAALAGTAYGAGWLDGPWRSDRVAAAAVPDSVRATFSLCYAGGGYNCVVDGDTIWLEGQNIRVADIDAPETHEPRCPSEKQLGDRATLRLQELVNSGTVTLQPTDRDEDNYGRKLRIVLVDGNSVGDALVSEGLARWYAGGRRPWC